jgi:hypothetical protein
MKFTSNQLQYDLKRYLNVPYEYRRKFLIKIIEKETDIKVIRSGHRYKVVLDIDYKNNIIDIRKPFELIRLWFILGGYYDTFTMKELCYNKILSIVWETDNIIHNALILLENDGSFTFGYDYNFLND